MIAWVVRQVALGKVTWEGSLGRYFVLACGAGLDAELMIRAETIGKKRWGMLAYWAAGLSMLGRRLERFRVEAETVRDIALSASGLLNTRIGGPSVFPPLPEFMILPPVSYGPKIWKTDTGPNRYRRGLYTFRYRSVPYPVLQTFDAPNGDFSCVRRVRSNGEIKWAGERIFVSEVLVGEPVGITETEAGDWRVCYADIELGYIDRRTHRLMRRVRARPR